MRVCCVGVTLAVVSFCLSSSSGMFQEEAGQLDFLLSTAGHKETWFAHVVKKAGIEEYELITSDGTDTLTLPTSCIVACRDLENGKLNWRRNVCSSSNEQQGSSSHAIVAQGDNIVTADSSGGLRSWNALSGALNWEITLSKQFLAVESTIYITSDGEKVVITGPNGVKSVEASTGRDVLNNSEEKVEDPLNPKSHGERVYCSEMNGFVVSIDEQKTKVIGRANETEVQLGPTLTLSEQDAIEMLHLLSCSAESMTFLVNSIRKTTMMVTIDAAYRMAVKWSAEEGLASVSSGLLLDASHYVEKTEGHSNILSFSSRLAMHWKSLPQLGHIKSFLSGVNDNSLASGFGFKKIAVLISDVSDRIYGMHTTGEERTTMKYEYDLMANADWHRVVHGVPNAVKGIHGINGKAHSKDLLVVSSANFQVSWLCLEGSTGHIHGRGSVQVTSTVSQMVPIGAGAGSTCRQAVLLIFEDLTSLVLPEDENTKALVAAHVAASNDVSNGFFAHRVKKDNATIETLRLSAQKHALTAEVLGMTKFPGEEVILVAYPDRDEVIQSPCNVLGDQSLLLKYLNPHLVVVMTKTKHEENVTDGYSKFIKNLGDKGNKQKRKPTGVGSPAEPTTGAKKDEDPNLFVNILDSVSGRVLYRASHNNAVLIPYPSLVVSENWIFYSFMSNKHRRAQIGVLSLYEGMVDSKGLTAFATPEQLTKFSCLDARESKPVVLAKAYSLAKPVTALGISSTRGGISGKKLILATADGQVFSVDRRMLEPRRPVGQVKDSEKEEGLRQYSELIPLITYMSLSYTQSVEGVKQVVSAPTDLESQTFVMAFGGPDIFFTRTSPSRGFDLLPESFNRIMLSIVVVVLISVALFLQKVVFNKNVSKGWA